MLLAVVLALVAALLIYSAIKKTNPLTTLKSTLGGS